MKPRARLGVAHWRVGAACLVAILLPLATACKKPPSPTPQAQAAALASPLKSPQDFANLGEKEQRSRAIFLEATRVLLHPRCKNCHPAGNVPLQGDKSVVHDPPALRGADNHGPPGMVCTSCHQDRNQELARVPGAPKWALAPIEMAWMDKTPQALCEQLKDPARNGHRDLSHIVDHISHDELVGWAWAPGHGRQPAPGTQAQVGALMAAWVESGAVCPREEAKP